MDTKTLVKALAAEFTRAARVYETATAGAVKEDEALAIQASVNRLALELGIAEELDRALRQELDYGHGPVLTFDPEEVVWA